MIGNSLMRFIARKVRSYYARKSSKLIKDISRHALRSSSGKIITSSTSANIEELLFAIGQHDTPGFAVGQLHPSVVYHLQTLLALVFTEEELARMQKYGALEYERFIIKLGWNEHKDTCGIIMSSDRLDLALGATKKRLYFQSMSLNVAPVSIDRFHGVPYEHFLGAAEELRQRLPAAAINKLTLSMQTAARVTWAELLRQENKGLMAGDCQDEQTKTAYNTLLEYFLTNRIHNTFMLIWIMDNEGFDEKVKFFQWTDEQDQINFCFVGERMLMVFSNNQERGRTICFFNFQHESGLKTTLLNRPLLEIPARLIFK